MKRLVLFILFFGLFFKITQPCLAAENNFITLVYPVRGRNLWDSKDLNQVNNVFSLLKNKSYPSTWLLQYDALIDQDLINKFKNECPQCETGLFLEVSMDQATAASVSYDTADSDWAKPTKVFLSGYNLLERERLIDTVFTKFKDVFGNYPKSVGAWYVDPYSLNYVVNKYHVLAYVSVADQHDTDSQRYWGKPWGYPFYPQKFNILASATDLQNKLDIVELQWAQRDPDSGFGSGVTFSQNSFQANDYLGNGNTTDYFLTLLNKYLNTNSPFVQVTLGLETGQELSRFEGEHVKQLESLSNMKVLKVSDFADWYKKTYPNLPPTTFVQGNNTAWVNGPTSRVGLRLSDKGWEVIDFKSYTGNTTSKDLYLRDTEVFLSREVGLNVGDKDPARSIRLEKSKEKIKEVLSVIKKSKLDGKTIMGIQTGKETIFAYWQGKGLGFYKFPFQVLTKFQSL